MVASASFDRGFPHTLRVAVVPEVPVAVLRQGASSWLAAAGGRVVAELDRGARPGLPRIWLKRDVDVRLGESVGGHAARALSPRSRRSSRSRCRSRVASVVATQRRADARAALRARAPARRRLATCALKLEVARRVLPLLAGSGGYLDVSVPERPVAGDSLDSQVEVEASTSTSP